MDDVLEAIKAGHFADRGAPVGLVDILERFDASQRGLLSHGELDSALRRLTESGVISDVGNRMFVARGSPTHDVYRPLTEAEYADAVRRYRDDFADNVAWLMRLPFFRRFAPASVDTDHVAISFAIERVVDRFGGTIGDAVSTAPLSYPVSLRTDVDRDDVISEIRDALMARSLSDRETWLMFADGTRARVGGLT
jgi:hypothetical protein